MSETQKTMSEWASETFGDPKSNMSIAVRANEEMAELLSCLRDDDSDPSAADEAADVIIVLMRLFTAFGVDFMDIVNQKMAINRGRQWNRTETGHGYHK